jgi:hypothetical protein
MKGKMRKRGWQVTLECGSPVAAFAETALLSGSSWVDV